MAGCFCFEDTVHCFGRNKKQCHFERGTRRNLLCHVIPSALPIQGPRLDIVLDKCLRLILIVISMDLNR